MSALQLWHTRCPVPTALGLAAQVGLLENAFADDHGIELCSLRESATPEIRESHYTHTQPASFRHGGCYPAIWAQANGADTKIIGLSTMPASTYQSVLVLPDSPLRNAADLRGKRILLLRKPHATMDFHYYNSLRITDKALASAGLTFDDVELVEHPVPAAIEGEVQGDALVPANLFPLVRGEVDAIIAGVTRSFEFQRTIGLRAIFDQRDLPTERQGHNGRPLTLAVKADLIRQRPDVVRKLLSSVLKAEALIAADPPFALRQFAKEFALSEQVAAHAYGESLADDLHVDFREDRIRALQSEVDFLARIGAIARPFDVEGWLDPTLLEELRGVVADEGAASLDFA